jgi:hypothetical protein
MSQMYVVSIISKRDDVFAAIVPSFHPSRLTWVSSAAPRFFAGLVRRVTLMRLAFNPQSRKLARKTRLLIIRPETVSTVTFAAVSRVNALLATGIPQMRAVTFQALPVLPTPAHRIILASFCFGFAYLAVGSERSVHRGIQQTRLLLQSYASTPEVYASPVNSNLLVL